MHGREQCYASATVRMMPGCGGAIGGGKQRSAALRPHSAVARQVVVSTQTLIISTQYLHYTVTSHHGQESGNTLGTGVGTGTWRGNIRCVDC